MILINSNVSNWMKLINSNVRKFFKKQHTNTLQCFANWCSLDEISNSMDDVAWIYTKLIFPPEN